MSSLVTKRDRALLLVLAIYISCLEVFSLLPGGPEGAHRFRFSVSDPIANTLHFVVYAGLAWLLFQLIEARYPRFGRTGLTTLAAATTIGVLNEVLQFLVPGRGVSFSDALLNFAGVVSAVSIKVWKAA